MQISDHYRPFEKKTLIAVTNNERARLFCALNRTIEEVGAIETKEPVITPDTRNNGADADAAKELRLSELYEALSDKIGKLLDREGYQSTMVCFPEVNKQTFAEKMNPEILKRIDDTVTKNLASMDVPHIIRILLEG